jgi:hypothetical protein
MDKYPDYPLEV